MITITNSNFYELTLDEQVELAGGSTVTLPVVPTKLGMYIGLTIAYNIQTSYINGYNNTVTSNGRTDLVKPYPEKPAW